MSDRRESTGTGRAHVQRDADALVERLAGMPGPARRGWLVYVLEAIEAELGTDDLESMLRAGLARLERGGLVQVQHRKPGIVEAHREAVATFVRELHLDRIRPAHDTPLRRPIGRAMFGAAVSRRFRSEIWHAACHGNRRVVGAR